MFPLILASSRLVSDKAYGEGCAASWELRLCLHSPVRLCLFPQTWLGGVFGPARIQRGIGSLHRAASDPIGHSPLFPCIAHRSRGGFIPADLERPCLLSLAFSKVKCWIEFPSCSSDVLLCALPLSRVGCFIHFMWMLNVVALVGEGLVPLLLRLLILG